MDPALDNVFWHALVGSHAQFAVGSGGARRYAPGLSPIIAFEDVERPDFASLAPHCEVGEKLYCSGWFGAVPAGWQLHVEAPMDRMVWGADVEPPDAPVDDALPLQAPRDADATVELAELTKPGPFGPRTIELGDYLGCFDAERRLVAMAGERVQAGLLREISGVCTHPEFQGRGLARRLMAMLIRRQLQRGETPFLNVLPSNAGAHALYRRMGFRVRVETNVRIISRG
ncbi:MAG TPA: GNAT family N-acetyltransferase [Burkholderiaceae bacterium]|jgi:ribosomal protein S18 acetylase RimI-like enzyme